MAGILLSGWRIRLFDSAGNPLYPGKVEFFDATTSLPKTIYADKDLTIPLGTSTTTDLEGYLPAIWLSDGYYKGVVSQRIQADPETWKVLWNINHLGKELASSGTAGSGVMAYCENIAELKAITAGTIDAALVAGYYNAGDCGDPMFFVWDASSTKTDDAGAYIRSNDTPSGTAGRYHQVMPTGVLDIRKWGGIPNSESIDCTGALINMGNYAADYELYPVTPPEIGFIAGGVYNFSGNTNLNRTWTNSLGTITKKIPYYVGNGVQFDCGSNTVTFTNPVKIESDSKLCEYPTSYDFGNGSVEFIRPQWMPDRHGNLADKITAAISNNFPVKVYGVGTEGELIIDSNITWDSEQPIYFESASLYFSTTDSYSIDITAPIYVPSNQYIFRCTTYINNNVDINASWFGWGHLPSTDQAPALQAALNAAKGQSIVVVPQLTNSSHILNSAVDGYTHQIEHTIRIEGKIIFGSAGSLSDVYLDVPYNQFCISADMTNFIHLMNPTISPSWFGARPISLVDSTNALNMAIIVGSRSRSIVDGGGCTFYVGYSLGFNITSTNALISIKNITINPRSNYNPTEEPYMMAIGGAVDVELESVNINPANTKDVNSLFLDVYWSRIRNCFFRNDVKIGDNAEDYAFTNNQLSGEIEGCYFSTASRSAIITGNSFSQCRVHLVGDAGVQTGYTFPMLQNIIVSNNIFNNLDGSIFKGCVYIITQAANTLVSGLNITNNIFSGNIPAWDNDGQTIDEFYRYRINQATWDGGTWAVSHQSDNDVRHLMVIKDNTYQWYDPTRAAPTEAYPYNSAGHRENYLPSTSGNETIKTRTLTGTTTVNGLIRDTWTYYLDPHHVFMLYGDTTTEFTTNLFSVRGWRRKTGDTTLDTFQSVAATMTVSGLKANTAGTATFDIQKTQYTGVAGSSGWSGSVVYYGFTWRIYEAY